MDVRRERIVMGLRRRLDLWGEPTDDVLLEQTKGSIVRYQVETRIAAEDFCRAVSRLAQNDAIRIGNALIKIGNKLRRR